MNNLLESMGCSTARLAHPEKVKSEPPPLPYGEFLCTPAEYIEIIANLPKGEPDSFGATPLNRTLTLQQQLELERTLRKRTYAVPSGVSMVVANYIQQTFAQRFHNRAEANEDNYESSFADGSEYTAIPGVEEMFTRGELGTASPAELLMIRKMKQIRSTELACLTHPYGTGIEMLEPMRDAVRQNVEHIGGYWIDEPKNRYRVKDIVKDEETGEVLGYLMTRKRTIGLMADGTEIRERSSFLLQVNAEIIGEMYGEGMKDFLNEYDLVQDQLHLAPISDAFLTHDQYSAAIPISSTIYAFNRDDAAQIKQRTETIRVIERDKFAKQYPLLHAVMQGEAWPLESAPETKTEKLLRKAKLAPTIFANKLKNLFEQPVDFDEIRARIDAEQPQDTPE